MVLMKRRIFVILWTDRYGAVLTYPVATSTAEEAKRIGKIVFREEPISWFVAECVDPLPET
jgi:hypothetical protein